jgi:hypothetical protein
MPFDLRGSCRSCGTKIATVDGPAVALAIPKTWGELWPTLVVSGLLGVPGAGLVVAGVICHRGFQAENVHVTWPEIGTACLVVGGGLLVAAAKCWLK